MNWTKEEFEIYSLLYAAHLDLKMDAKELTFISAETEPETFEKINACFQKDNDAQRLQNIMNHKDQFLKTAAQKDEFLKDLKTIFFSDGKYSAIESGIFSVLKRIL